MRNKERIQTPVGLLFDQALTTGDLRVFAILSYHWNAAEGISGPTRKLIASQARLSEGRVSAILTKLESQGWISRIRLPDDSRRFGYKIHWNNHPETPKIGHADVTEICEIGHADVTEIRKIGHADVTDREILEIGHADVTEICPNQNGNRGVLHIEKQSTTIGSYLLKKEQYLRSEVPNSLRRINPASPEISERLVDENFESAKAAIAILTAFGAPPQFLTPRNGKNHYQAWIDRGTSFRELIDACVRAAERRAEDGSTAPIGVAYVNAILTRASTGSRSEFSSAITSAEERFLNG